MPLKTSSLAIEIGVSLDSNDFLKKPLPAIDIIKNYTQNARGE
jgi:hypothetical protein